jgi:hypothetical protein
MSNFRNRIIGHRVVKARDLIPHDLNPRTHSKAQKEALSDLLGEVGFARSALAYVADKDRARLGYESNMDLAPLTLIDGHLRRVTLPDEEITVEVLDVNDEEARKLLLSIDPLSSLAGYSEDALGSLRQSVETESSALTNLWHSVADAQKAAERVLEDARQANLSGKKPKPDAEAGPDKFLVIIDCPGEKSQREALRICKEAGLKAKAVMS